MQNIRIGPHIGPKVSPEPERPPEGPSFLERMFEKSNQFARAAIGYNDPALLKESGRGEFRTATVRGYIFLAVPVFTGAVATVAADSLAGGGFSVFRCFVCFAAAGCMAAADSVILQSRIVRRGVRDLRDGGAYITLPSDSDRATQRIIALRVAQSTGFGLLVAGAVGLALNRPVIDARLDEDYLRQNHLIVEQAQVDYNAELAHAQSAYDTQRGIVDRLTKLRAHPFRRTNIRALDRSIASETQKLDGDRATLDQVLASRSDREHHVIETSPTRIPKSDGVISRVRALGEEFWDNPISAAVTLLIDGVIVAIDTLNLCLGGIGIGGALYPARAARRRLEELTQEARTVAQLGAPPDEPPSSSATADAGAGPTDGPPPSPAAGGALPPQPPVNVAANGAALPRRRGRPPGRRPAPNGAPGGTNA